MVEEEEEDIVRGGVEGGVEVGGEGWREGCTAGVFFGGVGKVERGWVFVWKMEKNVLVVINLAAHAFRRILRLYTRYSLPAKSA